MKKYIKKNMTPEERYYYDLGGWMQQNAGLIGAGVGAGAGIGLAALTGGATAPLTPMLAQAGQRIGNNIEQNNAEKINSRTNLNMPNQMTQLPANSLNNNYKCGGKMYEDGGPIEPSEGFKLWFKYNTPEGRQGISYDDPEVTYDYLSYYNDAVTGKNPMGFDEESQHFPDTYKYPNHPSFSDESINYKKGMDALSYGYKNPNLPYTDDWNDVRDRNKKPKLELIKRADGGKLEQGISNFYPQDIGNYAQGGYTHDDANINNTYEGIPIGDKATIEKGEFIYTNPYTKTKYVFTNSF